MMRIPIEDQPDLLLYAFRYTLGRATPATASVSRVLRNAWPSMSLSERNLYQHEIEAAIHDHNAGMRCDVDAWKTVLDLDPFDSIVADGLMKGLKKHE